MRTLDIENFNFEEEFLVENYAILKNVYLRLERL